MKVWNSTKHTHTYGNQMIRSRVDKRTVVQIFYNSSRHPVKLKFP